MSNQAPPPPVDWVIGFNWVIDRKATQALLTSVHQAIDLGAKKVTLCLSSPGGATDQAFYAYEILLGMGRHVELTTHNVGTVQSAAVPLFLAGSRRLAVQNSTFLFHNTTHNTGGSVTLDHVTYGVESIKADDVRSIGIVVDRTGRDLATVQEWFVGQKLRDTDFARAANLLTDVKPLEFSTNSKFHQVLL